MFSLFRWINAITDPTLPDLEEQLRARPRKMKFADYIERHMSHREPR